MPEMSFSPLVLQGTSKVVRLVILADFRLPSYKRDQATSGHQPVKYFEYKLFYSVTTHVMLSCCFKCSKTRLSGQLNFNKKCGVVEGTWLQAVARQQLCLQTRKAQVVSFTPFSTKSQLIL